MRTQNPNGIIQVLLTIYYKKIHQNVSDGGDCHQGIYGDQFPFYYHKLTSYNHRILKFSFWCINKKSKLTALSMFAAKFVINDSAMRTNNISIYNTGVKRFTGIEINGSLRSEEGTSSETSAIMALKNL